MRPTSAWVRLATAAGGAAVLLAGSQAASASPASHGAPVIRPAPAHAPTMTRANGSCTAPSAGSSSPATTSDDPLLWVRAHPTGVVAIWVPGLNSTRCVARRTTNGGARARKIAVAIRHAKAFPTEPLPCPYDDGTSVRLYFSYASGGDEYAAVSLSGCRPIRAPGRASRWGNTSAVERSLRPAAPRAWQSYLATG
ncbi:MAG TPA: hypothetical protein VHC43_12920 [Mycobacteriales bacterium]|nr:hypothetical protein [Mycobacteriales bacterium]